MVTPLKTWRTLPSVPSSVTILRDLARAVSDAIGIRVEQFPAVWYYLTRSTSLAREEEARERYWKSADPPRS